MFESGEEVPLWVTIATRWASIEARGRVPGGELILGQQLSAEATHKITMRFFEDVSGGRLTPKHRLKMGDRIFNIEAISNPGERGGTTFMTAFVKEQV